MPKPSINLDLSALSNSVDQADKRVFKLSKTEVNEKLTKIAFDVYKMTASVDPDELWQIQEADDGNYIVARYDNSDEEDGTVKTAAIKTSWTALAQNNQLHIFYKNYPVIKLSAKQFDIKDSELPLLARTLPSKLASEEGKSLRSALIQELPLHVRSDLFKLYPELAK